ncbi:S8 family peptidase [Nonomuraea sp. NPDC050790]|uniref:S8 family peptidase n=1 Tax=Nonomuraea sp. NPDC050790 TaxID=3364371 RepID=UPI0037A3284B
MLSAVRLVTAAALAFSGTAPPPVRDQQEWVLDALNVEQAWTLTKGADVVVAVVDSGVDTKIKELKDKVTVGPDMTEPALDRQLPPGRHGTAMAALIAGSGADGGLVGVAPEAKILSLPLPEEEGTPNFLPPAQEQSGSRESPLARAIRYAANHGAKVVSLSLGAYGPHKSEREAVSYALGKGVVLVAAVGNDGQTRYAKDNNTSYWSFPAGYPGVIGVGAVDRQGRRAAFSSDNLSVLVAAPGVEVPVVKGEDTYELSSGTSSATALVAGVAALIKSKYPQMSPAQVSQAIALSARGRPAAGYDEKVGFGTVDAAAALNAAQQLTGQRREVEAPTGKHFGEGEESPQPSPPGPDPWRLWLYGVGVILALVTFCGAIIVLNQRKR